MSQKNKAPKLYVVEKKTASGKSWSKKTVAEARSFVAAVDRLVSLPDKVGEFRIRRLAAGGKPAKVMASRTYNTIVIDDLSGLANEMIKAQVVA